MCQGQYFSLFIGYYIIQFHDICASANQRPGGYLCFSINPTPTPPPPPRPRFMSSFVKFHSAVSEKSKMSQPTNGRGILSFRAARIIQTWYRTLKSCFLSSLSFIKFHSAVSEEKSKMSQPIRGRGGYLGFPIGPKKKTTNLLEDNEILLPVKFLQIPFSSFRGEIKMYPPIIGMGGNLKSIHVPYRPQQIFKRHYYFKTRSTRT